MGRYTFHAIFISLSYRYRGRVTRTHTQRNTNSVVLIYRLIELVEELKNIQLIIKLRKRILPYSAMKIKAKPTAPYSTLNPDTSSDSPSAKSKGVRLVSAKHTTTNIIISGMQMRYLFHRLLTAVVIIRLRPPVRNKKSIINRAKQISYEIVWATARMAPTRAYFLLEAQPLIRVGYTFKAISIYI